MARVVPVLFQELVPAGAIAVVLVLDGVRLVVVLVVVFGRIEGIQFGDIGNDGLVETPAFFQRGP